MQKYDPMVDFWKRGIDFLFKQAPAVTIALVASLWLIYDRGDVQANFRKDIAEAKRECAAQIAEVRQELRTCRVSNDTLMRQNIDLHLRLLSLEMRSRKGVK